jgi:type IV pilus assembly protein PilP
LRRRLPLALGVAIVWAGCGGGEADKGNAPRPVPKPPAAAPAAPSSPVTKLAGPAPVSRDSLLADARKRQLSNEDFVESDNNRDPFRSFLATFAAQAPTVTVQHKILLQKFALDELKLAAIVEGEDVPPRAMFIDPSGFGVNVTRGDHVSKSDAAVTRIAPDRVFFEIEEDAGSGKTRKVERVIELHAGEVTGAQ